MGGGECRVEGVSRPPDTADTCSEWAGRILVKTQKIERRVREREIEYLMYENNMRACD